MTNNLDLTEEELLLIKMENTFVGDLNSYPNIAAFYVENKTLLTSVVNTALKSYLNGDFFIENFYYDYKVNVQYSFFRNIYMISHYLLYFFETNEYYKECSKIKKIISQVESAIKENPSQINDLFFDIYVNASDYFELYKITEEERFIFYGKHFGLGLAYHLEDKDILAMLRDAPIQDLMFLLYPLSYRKVYDMSNLWYTGNEMNYELECMGLVTFEQKCSYFITILIEKIRKILKNN